MANQIGPKNKDGHTTGFAIALASLELYEFFSRPKGVIPNGQALKNTFENNLFMNKALFIAHFKPLACP